MPLVEFGQGNKTITHSVEISGEFGAHVFAERCCTAQAAAEGAEGAPIRFNPQAIQFTADSRVMIQFEASKLRTDTEVHSAHIAFEMVGHRWGIFQGDRFASDSTEPFAVDIRAEWSAHSMAEAYEKNNIETRVMTQSVVRWDMPFADNHEIVRTPDLSSLLQEVQTVSEWNERCTLSFAFEPVHDGTQPSTGGREFKVLYTGTEAFLVSACPLGSRRMDAN